MLKALYITIGSLTLGLGLLGIITPGLPTTPFLLLTAFFYARSSPKLYQRLLDHKITGRYIKRVNGGLSIKARIISIALMWCMVCFSAFIIFGGKPMQYVMLGLGCVGTIAQIIVLGKKKKPQKEALQPMTISSVNEENIINKTDCSETAVNINMLQS